MIRRILWSASLVGLIACSPGSMFAQDNQALLDALVKKGVLTEKEANKIEADVEKQANAPVEQKNLGANIHIGDWVKELDLSGDIRLRNQWDQSSPQLPAFPGQTNYDKHVQRDRWRFRLRLNIDFKLDDNFFGGVQLSTSDNRNGETGNATFTGGYDNYSIYISRAFLGWRPIPGLTIVGGKQENPFYGTDLFWSPDTSPQGVVERVDFDKIFGWNDSGSAGEPVADGKEAPPPPPAPPSNPNKFELALIAGQFIFFDNSENSAFSQTKWDAFQFETQLKAKWTGMNGKLSATFAPAVFIANAASIGMSTVNSSGKLVPPASQVAGAIGTLNNANPFPVTDRGEFFLFAPGDITYKFNGFPVALYWDLSYNVWGNDRWNNVYGPLFSSVGFNAAHSPVFPASSQWGPSVSDNLAWLVGLRFGQNKKAGDFSLAVDYREVGIDSIDPNLNHDDINLSMLNFRGFTARVAYNITDFLTIGVQGFFTWNLSQNLVGGFATGGGFPIANFNNAQVIQVDLNMKF